jgi:hypothetical protein
VNLHRLISLTSLLGFAFLANVPLGYLREESKKFSLRWFVLIHISIPFIILLRISGGFGWEIIPLTLGCAVAGQLLGAFLKRRSAR